MPEHGSVVDPASRLAGELPSCNIRDMNPTWTAIGVAALRAWYSALGDIDDPCARDLVPAPLRVALRPAVARALHQPVRILSRDLSLTVPLRTRAIDQQLAAAVAAGARQLVVLGSGLDARAWRMPALAETAVFEVDRGRSHTFKTRRMARHKDLSGSHAFIDSDLGSSDLAARLASAGFRAERPTIWLCEGVFIYVPRAVSDHVLDTVGQLSAPGSVFIATYMTPDLGAARFPMYLRAGAWLIGEPLRGGLTPQQLSSMLANRGFRISRDAPVKEWTEPKTPGSQWERLVVAVRGT